MISMFHQLGSLGSLRLSRAVFEDEMMYTSGVAGGWAKYQGENSATLTP